LQIIYAKITDPGRLGAYAEQAQRLFAQHGAKLIARGAPTVFEGDWPWQGAVVFEWPSRQAAEAVWHADAYATLHRLREGAAEFQVVVIDTLS
jgi:uncharacterized protein (DUF1330 family)